jgi:hypothetical protein
MHDNLSPQFKGIWMLIFSLETFHLVADKHCNSICLINASYNGFFINKSLENILIYNLDEFRMEFLFNDPKS